VVKKILRILQEAILKLESERKKIEKIREYDRKIKELYEKEKILLQFADAFCMCITSGRIEDAEKLLKEGEFKIEGIEINQLVPKSKMDPEIFKRKVQNLVNKINSKIENIEKKKAALMERTDIPKHISERRRFVEKLQHRV
jgi:esterase/lipase